MSERLTFWDIPLDRISAVLLIDGWYKISSGGLVINVSEGNVPMSFAFLDDQRRLVAGLLASILAVRKYGS